MAAHPASSRERGPTAAPRPAALTYGALWDLCDGERTQAECLRAQYAEDAATPRDPHDSPFYERRLRECALRALQFQTLQALLGRIIRSNAIKHELKEIAARERAE